MVFTSRPTGAAGQRGGGTGERTRAAGGSDGGGSVRDSAVA